MIFRNFFKNLVDHKVINNNLLEWELKNDFNSCGDEDIANIITMTFMEKIALNEPVEMLFEDPETGEMLEEPNVANICEGYYLKISEFVHLSYNLTK